jgi:Phage capsid protein
MAVDITDAFIKQYESDVHMAYQRMGTKLRNTIRVKNGVRGSSTTFQKVGSGTASQKTRHGNVSPMNIDHTPVECTLADWYAADYIDKLDELKINIDERMVVSQNGAYALGRKTDELIVTAMDTTSNVQTEASTNRLTTTKINLEFVRFGESDIPDDGGRHWVVSPDQWIDLLGITAFSSADYVGPDQLPYKAGMAAKVWMTFLWFQFSGLPETTNIRKTFAYHRNCIGHAIGADVTSEINYIPEKVAHLATSMMSQGSVLIDATGVSEVQCYAA